MGKFLDIAKSVPATDKGKEAEPGHLREKREKIDSLPLDGLTPHALPVAPAAAVLDIVGRAAPISHPLILKEMQGLGFSKTISANAISQLQGGRWIEHDLMRGYILSQGSSRLNLEPEP